MGKPTVIPSSFTFTDYLLVQVPENCAESDGSVLEQVEALMGAHGTFGKDVYDALSDGGVDLQEVGRSEATGRVVMETVASVAGPLTFNARSEITPKSFTFGDT